MPTSVDGAVNPEASPELSLTFKERPESGELADLEQWCLAGPPVAVRL